MFQKGDKIVHPMHGAGIVEGIVERKINGVVRTYYSLKLPVRAMVVMVPTEAAMTSNWNRRYRENMERMKSGNLFEVARVVKGLTQRDNKRGLSTGERKMLHSAKQILISELVLSQDSSYEDIEARINHSLIQS